jgi:hypothetical protein
MLPFSEAKRGDWVRINFDGEIQDGEIVNVNLDEGQIGVQTTSGNTIFCTQEQVNGIPLDDEQLKRLRFEREVMPEGFIKYKHGPFRLVIERPGDFTHSKIWYREDKRQINYPLMVHQLQNHYRSMTNVELTAS